MLRRIKRRVLSAAVAVVGAVAGIFTVLDYWRIRPDEPVKADAIRVTYYRLGGATADLLVQGLLPKEWKEALGGPQEIVSNEVLDAARNTLQKFREPLIGDLLLPSAETSVPLRSRTLDEYAAGIDQRRMATASTRDWQAYLGGQPNPFFFVPDITALEQYIGTETMPPGYSAYHVKAYGKTTPIIWRWMRADDLLGYEGRLREFRSRFLSSDQTYLGINMMYASPAYINGLRHVAARGMPAEFVLMVGYPTVHGGWTIEARMRDFEFEVAVIENLRDKPVRIESLTYRSWGEDALRTSMATDGALSTATVAKRPLTAAMTMAPREKVIVPTRVSFAYRQGNDIPYGLTGPDYPPAANMPDMVDVWLAQVNGRDRIVRKRRDEVSRSVLPPIVERFDFGPSWLLEAMVAEGVQIPIRRADWANMTLHFGNYKGSCPFVYTRRDRNSPWISEGHVLLGAIRADQERADSKILTRFDGTLVLRETEDEVAFVRRVILIVETERGEQVQLLPEQQPDGYWTIQRGEQLELNFPDFSPSLHFNPRVEVTGYYRPYSLFWLDN